MLKQKRETTYAKRHIAKLPAFPHLVESIEHMTLELDILPSKIGHRWLFQQFGIAILLHWIALVEWHLQGSKALMRSRAAKPGSKCQRCVCDSLPISRTSTLSPAQSIVVAVGSSGILKGKQKLGLTFNFDKQDAIDFTKFSKMTMCWASEANS